MVEQDIFWKRREGDRFRALKQPRTRAVLGIRCRMQRGTRAPEKRWKLVTFLLLSLALRREFHPIRDWLSRPSRLLARPRGSSSSGTEICRLFQVCGRLNR